jgi:predicted nucleotidyltransferase
MKRKPGVHAPVRQLATLLASPALSRLVTHFVLQPKADLHFQALKRATALPNRSLQLELARLENFRLLSRHKDGRFMRYRVSGEELDWNALRDCVRHFAGPAEVLRIALARLPGIRAAFIYGSFARGHDVHSASDVDLFIVADRLEEPLRDVALAGIILEVSGLLSREVNVSRYTPAHLASKLAAKTRFLSTVLAGEKEWLIGDERAMSRAVAEARARVHGGVPT